MYKAGTVVKPEGPILSIGGTQYPWQREQSKLFRATFLLNDCTYDHKIWHTYKTDLAVLPGSPILSVGGPLYPWQREQLKIFKATFLLNDCTY